MIEWSVTMRDEEAWLPGGLVSPHHSTESDSSSVVQMTVARLKRRSIAAMPEMTGAVSSTSAVAVTAPLPPWPLSLS